MQLVLFLLALFAWGTIVFGFTSAFLRPSPWRCPHRIHHSTATVNDLDLETKEDLFVKWMSTDSWKEIHHPGIQLEVIGSIPSYVKGVYIKNGPGAFGTPDGTRKYKHAFDGLAKLQKFDIDGNNVTFTTRFVESRVKKGMLNNKIPGHISTGPVDPPFRWWDILLNTMQFDNTCVNIEELSTSGVYAAVTDAAVRQEIDLTTLETIRRIPNGRILGTDFVTQFSTAHSKVSRRDGLTYNYYLESGLENWAHIVRTNKDLTQSSIGKIKVGSEFSYVHEISVTDSFAILVLCPVVVSMGKLVKSSTLLPSLDFRPTQSTKIVVFDLNGDLPVQSFEAPPFWCYHHVNSYQDGSTIVLDLLAYDTPEIANGPHGYLYLENMLSEESRLKEEREGDVWRFVLNLDSSERYVKPEKKVIFDEDTGLRCSMELISVAPDRLGRSYRYVYGFTGFYKGMPGYMDWAIRKQDVAENSRHGTWYEEYMYPGEVTFIRNPDGSEEDDGVLLSTVFDSRRGENCLLVLDASSMTELARAYTGIGL